MAISIVQSKISAGATFTGTTGTTLSFASTPSTSNKLVIAIWGWNNVNGTTWSISDNQTGNTYNLRSSAVSNANADDPSCWLYDCSPVGSTGTFTIKFQNTDSTANNTDVYIGLFEVSGLGAFDKSNQQTRITSASYNTGSTGTLTNASEFVVAVTSSDALGITPPGGAWTNLGKDTAGTIQGGSIDYQIVSATTALSAAYTNSAANFVSACIGTWQAAAGGAADESINNRTDVFDVVSPTDAINALLAQDTSWAQILPADIAADESIISTARFDFYDGGLENQFSAWALDLSWIQFIQDVAGTIYNDTVAETGAAADTVDATTIIAAAIAETGAALETLTGLLILAGAIAETGAAAETVTGLLVMAGAIAETGSAVDTLTGGLLVSDSVNETTSSADTVSTVLLIPAASVETGAAADTVTGLMVMPATAAETGAAVDTLTGLMVFAAAVAEAGSAVDTWTGGSLFAAAIAEAASAADTVSTTLTMPGAIAETLAALETLTGLLVMAAAVSETGFAGDTLTGLMALAVSVAEAGSALETVALAGTTYNDSVAEVGSAADTVSAAIAVTVSVQEAGAATDAHGAVLSAVGGVSEAAAAVETINTTAVSNVSVAEAANAHETTNGTTGGGGSQPTFSVGGDSVTDLYPSADITYPNGVTRQTGHT